MDLSPLERAMFLGDRSLTTDPHGVEILVGLTPEESIWYVAYNRARAAGTTVETAAEKAVNGDRYLALHNRMELARFQVMGAEHVLETERPTRN